MTDHTEHDVDFIPVSDALLRALHLAFGMELPVLGINTHFATNSRTVLTIVDDTFGAWQSLDARYLDASPGVDVRIVVHDGVEGTSGNATVRHLCPDATRVVAQSVGSVGLSDPERRDAVAFVTRAMVADQRVFREAMLEALTFALLSHFDRHPIHAAGIAQNGHAVLLAGASGMGKSTLAHVAHEAGISVLSDDHVWVQRSPALRIWGVGAPGHVRLFPNGAPNGTTDKTTKVVVALDARRDDPAAYVAERATVCVLARGNAATLERVDENSVMDALTRRVDPGFDRFPERHLDVARALAARGGWRLTLTDDPRAALPHLRTMLTAP